MESLLKSRLYQIESDWTNIICGNVVICRGEVMVLFYIYGFTRHRHVIYCTYVHIHMIGEGEEQLAELPKSVPMKCNLIDPIAMKLESMTHEQGVEPLRLSSRHQHSVRTQKTCGRRAVRFQVHPVWP